MKKDGLAVEAEGVLVQRVNYASRRDLSFVWIDESATA